MCCEKGIKKSVIIRHWLELDHVTLIVFVTFFPFITIPSPCNKKGGIFESLHPSDPVCLSVCSDFV